MVDIVRKYHKKYEGFFTPEECEHIISVFERDKEKIPYGDNTGYEGLTSTYQTYNWLYNEDIQPLGIEQRLFRLPEFKKWEYMILQCWGNALSPGEELTEHYHGNPLEHEWSRRLMFYNANIFLGGEYNLTWYEDTDMVENKVGDITIFTCDLDHKVEPNIGNDTRYSMALDIYPEWGNKIPLDTVRFRTAKNEYTQYQDTSQMRFYTARALFAVDFHNQCIMDESFEGTHNQEAIRFHTVQRQRLIDWMTEYKEYIHKVEQTNRDYGFEAQGLTQGQPNSFGIDRANKKT